jgi:TPR repeat protein
MLALRTFTRSTIVIAGFVALQPIHLCAVWALDNAQDLADHAPTRPSKHHATTIAFPQPAPRRYLDDGATAKTLDPSVLEASVDRRLVAGTRLPGATGEQFYQNVQGTVDVSVPRQIAPSDLAYLERARALVRANDIAAARLIFTRLANGGVAEAAFELGRTYDPDFLEIIPLAGLKPDLEMAKQWYRRAAALGNADAKSRLAKFEKRDIRQ